MEDCGGIFWNAASFSREFGVSSSFFCKRGKGKLSKKVILKTTV